MPTSETNHTVKSNKNAPIAYCSYAFELAADAADKSEMHLLPAGHFRTRDGVRPKECPSWFMDATVAEKLISLAKNQKDDFLIDFEHQNLLAATNGMPVIAAGWCPRSFEWREGSGFYATNIVWAGDTAQMIKAKQYRYVSCVFLYDRVTGEVTKIINFCLTNQPALDGLDPLAALTTQLNSEGLFMPDGKTPPAQPNNEVAALTTQLNTAQQNIAALTTERDNLKTSIAALSTERDNLKAAAEKATAEAEASAKNELIQAALTATVITPAQKPMLEKMALADLKAFVEAGVPVIDNTKQNQADGKGEADLTADELAMCTTMGVDPKDFIKTKQT